MRISFAPPRFVPRIVRWRILHSVPRIPGWKDGWSHLLRHHAARLEGLAPAVDLGDDEAAAQRFRSECQILARLDHPAIARLLDGGTASDDRATTNSRNTCPASAR